MPSADRVISPKVPLIGTPTSAGEPSTAVTVRVSPASTSVSFASTLPAAKGSPANGVLPGLTPLSITASPALVSSTATGASLVPLMVMVSAALDVAPLASVIV